MSDFRPPIIVDSPEMKGLLATSTAFLQAECYAQRAVLLNKPTDAVFFWENGEYHITVHWSRLTIAWLALCILRAASYTPIKP